MLETQERCAALSVELGGDTFDGNLRVCKCQDSGMRGRNEYRHHRGTKENETE